MDQTLAETLARLGCPEPLCSVSCGATWHVGDGETLSTRSPIDNAIGPAFAAATSRDAQLAIAAACDAFLTWRIVPAPVRGEFVRQFGNQLRRHQEDLAQLITWEAGKIVSEARGEVQEMIDICDFAVGLSRQIAGKTLPSERPGHRLSEYWHPLGPIGVISAFNFPVAVWAWNAALAWVCGDPVVWKPSEKMPLCAIACQSLVQQTLRDMSHVPSAISSLVVGGSDVGQTLANSTRLPLISATGSVRMGKAVGQVVAGRLGKSLLELGGNNGLIVTPSADLELAVRAILFAAVGTCGQRCTTLRRLIVHRSLAQPLVSRLIHAYQHLPIGDPRSPSTLVGPLIDFNAYDSMQTALCKARAQGATIHGGEHVTADVPKGGVYVRPAIVELTEPLDIVKEETFAPILYVLRYDDWNEAIQLHNDVPQGLSSAVLTAEVREAEQFCGPAGSDCGIVNVNVGTSGAEIGGAFGGEKETGGGRESGSDSWKSYMRRVTSTVNYSGALPLAQGVQFDLDI